MKLEHKIIPSRNIMNITRNTLSIALLLSVAFVSAHDEVTNTPCPHGCDHSSVSVEAVVAPEAVTKTVSIDEIIATATQEHNLNDAEVAQVRTRLEADVNADISAIVSEIRAAAQAEAEAAQKTAEVTQVMI
jgi:hypothetical protein